jgi:hypothetical protein
MIKMINSMISKVRNIWEDSYSVTVAVIATIGIVLLCLALVFGSMCLQAWLVMLLWNWVAVELFGLPAISFWLAFGLRWLCGLLFRSRTTTNKESDD